MAKPPAPLDQLYGSLTAVKDAADRIISRSGSSMRPADLTRLRLIWQTLHPRGYVPDRVAVNQYGNLAAFSGTMQLPTRRLAEGARTRVSTACRSAVNNDNHTYRASWFEGKTDPRCEVTGVPIAFETSDTCYKAPYTFSAIVDAFLRSRRRHVELQVTLLQPATDWDGDALSVADTNAFRALHQELATFRVVERAYNRQHFGRLP